MNFVQEQLIMKMFEQILKQRPIQFKFFEL